MSFNQSRFDKNDSAQYRKSARSASFNQPRSSSGAYFKGGAPAPSPPLSSSSSAAGRSFKKPGNAQVSQPRVSSIPSANHQLESAAAPSAPLHSVNDGSSARTQTRGSSHAPLPSIASKSAEIASAPPRGPQTVPKAPASQSTTMRSDSSAPMTPVKAPGDASKGFAFQFGSISPGFVNGMQVPARTSSAPPNIDELKQDQERHEPVKSIPPVPILPVVKQQLPSKELVSKDQLGAAEDHSTAKAKKETPAQLVSSTVQGQKQHVHQVPRKSMPMTSHQPQIPLQFSGPNPQIQSQGMPPTSIQMQMQIPLSQPVANAPPQVQQQIFIPGLPPQQLPPQGILHQSQGLSFPQLPAHLGNLGMGIGQYPQQQGQFGSLRKTPVKITHPDTHQEVKLDKPSDALPDGGLSSRSQPNVPPPSQPLSAYPAGPQFNYYHDYGTSGLYYPGPGSLPPRSAQVTPATQGPRYSYSVNQGPQSAPFQNSQANDSFPSGRTGVSKQGTAEQARREQALNSRDDTRGPSEAVKQAGGSITGRTIHISSSHNSATPIKIEPPKHRSLPKPRIDEESASLQSETTKQDSARIAGVSSGEPSSSSANCLSPEISTSALLNTEDGRTENHSRSNPAADDVKKQAESSSSLPQVEELVPPSSSSPRWVMGAQGDVSVSGISDSLKFSGQPHSKTGANGSTSISEQRMDRMGEDGDSVSPLISDATLTVKTADPGSVKDEEPTEKIKIEDQGSIIHVDGAKSSPEDFGNDSGTFSLESSQGKEGEEASISVLKAGVERVPDVCSGKNDHDELVNTDAKVSVLSAVDGSAKEFACTVGPTAGSHGEDISSLTAPESVSNNIVYEELAGSADNSFPGLQEKARTDEDVGVKTAGKEGSVQTLSSHDKPVSELNRTRSTTARGKKKRRELLQKADAAGSTSDLYMAYKGPKEKKVMATPSESAEIASPIALVDAYPSETAASEDGDESKAELDDWEDAADISTPKLESTTDSHEEGSGCIAKKYSRDFLLKFADQYTSLPEHFEVRSDIADAFISGVNIPRSPHPSPGRPSSGPRLDRRGSGVREDDRWAKMPGPSASGHDVGLAGNLGFRPGQGANCGVLRNPRTQMPMQYGGGILPGLMQPPGSQGGMQRTGSDADRWQRATGFQQKGLIPSPQTPQGMMHRAEKKYEVGKVTDEEQAKQRQLKAILNKLTPQNFEKLFAQVLDVQIDNAITLTGLISQIFDKALMEPTFCEMYANLCSHLSQALPDCNEGDEKITFKRLLLNKCQEEFERGEREQEEANKIEEEGEVKQTKEEREEKRVKARRRMLGNIRLIGELYKKRMLTEKIMHECMKKLLGQYQTPDEEDLEALCKLMSTIGEMIDHSKAKVHMDAYFERMTALSNNMALSSRVRFMLKDSIDLRKNKWQQRRKVEGPKKIEEVHRDAAQERNAQSSRVARSPGINTSGRRGPQMEFAPRGNPLSSPNAQMGSFRGLSSQTRGYGGQDFRVEERHIYEPRTLSVPLSQRSMGDDAITLGPQGGLGRGLSVRGPSSEFTTSLSDVPSGIVDGRNAQVVSNGFGSIKKTNSFSSREDSTTRSAALSDQWNGHGGRDVRNARYSSDRPSTAPLSSQGNGTTHTQNAPSEKVWPAENVQDLSIAAIREYYSAKDEKEVAQCIKDLKTPSFYPSMISLWVTDSFERKDMERDLLSKLLVNLCKPQLGMLTQVQLIQGFESVLTTLEDAVNDAPKAPEFLGRIFGRVIGENAVPLSEIGRILYQGGEEQGQLLEAGIAADVLGFTLQVIHSDKGDVAFNEIRRSSNLRLEDFRPPAPITSRLLEKFI